MKLSAVLLASGLLVVGAGHASAGPIIAPVSGVVDVSGPGFGSLSDTFSQAGLSTTYIPGVTDFDTYIATNPVHTSTFAGFEWFSAIGSNSAQVTYDFGSIFSIDALALWNEEASGIGVLSVYGSTDGVTFAPLLLRVLPADNPNGQFDYSAEVFAFGAASARYVRFDMSECPQQPGTFDACAIGEVAFRSASASEVPEPATLLLFGGGAMALARLRRRATRETV